MRRLLLGSLIAVAPLIASCGNGSTGPDPATGTLMTEDLVVGTGPTAGGGDTVTVHYIGSLTNGQVFDNSYVAGAPITFRLGAGQVIAGFDQGVVGMKVGGKRRLTIPPNLGYGAQPKPSIPPNSTLVFEVELLSVTR
jgi:FKBP-type peptidyl-prolyl cis-trans isomerase FkpA